ncbi:MFS transporter, partial [Nocardiopsis sp. MG754419]|uniref:MFS transporter n=1 Tax=Nocardiopsis sp. MG754419 TaxID=2259865 RepID=UPI0035B30465
ALRRAGVTGPAPIESGPTAPSGTDGASGTPSGRPRSLLLSPALFLVFAMCMLIVSGIVGMDLVIVAWANELDAPQYVMALASVWALGSLVGGAVAGALKGTPRLALRAFAAAAGIAILVPFLPPLTHLSTPLLITPLLFVSGLALAPTLAAVMGRLGDTAPPRRRAEAFGWMATAMSTGAAVAGPLTGALVDGNGIAGGAVGAAALVTVAAVLTLFLRPVRSGDGTLPAEEVPAGPAEITSVVAPATDAVTTPGTGAEAGPHPAP